MNHENFEGKPLGLVVDEEPTILHHCSRAFIMSGFSAIGLKLNNEEIHRCVAAGSCADCDNGPFK